MAQQSHNLTKIIANDLFSYSKVPLAVLALIFASAMSVVFATHHTREAIYEKDLAQQERERLDNEWRNLLLEENALAEHSRVQAIAQQELDMKRPDADKEIVVNLK